MKNVVVGVLIFVGGVGTGVLATNGYFKNKYEREIREIREHYKAKNKSIEEKVEECKEIATKLANDIVVPKAPVPTSNAHPRKPDLDELAVQYGYKQESELEAGEDDPAPQPLTRLERRKNADEIPYVIPPDEFGEVGYEQIELTYYDDGVLADDDDEIIDDPEAVVGPYALTSFGKYEDDAVFVRNDARRCDYEILADHRNYDDVVRPRNIRLED